MKKLALITLIIFGISACASSPKKFAYPINKPKVDMHEVCDDQTSWAILEVGETCESWGMPFIGVLTSKEQTKKLFHYIKELEIRAEQSSL